MFFFSSRRRHTRYWRDWSSDVCSSDLGRRGDRRALGGASAREVALRAEDTPDVDGRLEIACAASVDHRSGGCDHPEGSGDRKSVVSGKRVDLGGRRIIKKKK